MTADAPTRGPGRPALYPWDTWLDGEVHELRKGVDYPADKITSRMRTQILNTAKQRGMIARTEVDKATGTIKLIPIYHNGAYVPGYEPKTG